MSPLMKEKSVIANISHLKTLVPPTVPSRVESYEGWDRVLRPPHRHRLLRRFQWRMRAAVSPAAGSSRG